MVNLALPRIGLLSWALALLCAALLAAVGLEVHQAMKATQATQHPDDAMVAGSREHPPLPPLRPAINFPQLSAYSEVVERPLFDPSRRPPPKPEAEEAMLVQFDQLELRGILSTSGRSLAIIYDKREQQTLRLKEGDRLGPWALAELRDDGLVFSKGAATHKLQLRPWTQPKQATKARPSGTTATGPTPDRAAPSAKYPVRRR